MHSPTRIRLILLFGGRSAEHDVSRVSAFHVLTAVDPERYEVVPIGIDRAGTWRRSINGSAIATGDSGSVASTVSLDMDGEPIDPSGLLARPTSEAPVSGGRASQTVVFPVLHGPNGEDGTIQGFLETLGVPYVGAGVLGSALAMDKAAAKTILGAHGIAQPRWRAVRGSELRSSKIGAIAESVLADLGEEVFVKPANMGSSIGVSRAKGSDQLLEAMEVAAGYDDLIVIEESIRAREIETAVLGNDELEVGPIGEIRPAADFYDYEDKYSDGAARTVIPAQLDASIEERIRTVALDAYRALRAEGMARVDLFLDETQPDPNRQVMVNEINTIPGFTPISMYPQLWEHGGLGYSELIDRLVDLAIERHERRARHRTDVTLERN